MRFCQLPPCAPIAVALFACLGLGIVLGPAQIGCAQTYHLPANGQQGLTVYPASSSNTNVRVSIPWYQALITEREHNFGVVAKASKQEHVFEFQNTTADELLLTNVRTSCGCTKPSILTPSVKPGETGKVQAILDTNAFHGSKGATLAVSVQKVGTYVEHGEFQFAVKGVIRRDVVFNPGAVSFDGVTLEGDAVRTIRVSYAGNPDWKITDVKSSSPALTIKSKELTRDRQAGRVDYELVVTLDHKQAAGTINEFISIVTNDTKTTGMHVHAMGWVKPTLEAAPIRLGILHQGTNVTKKWIIRGSSPFQIDQIQCASSAIKFDPVGGQKSLHIVTYTLDTSKTLTIDEPITIVTNAGSQTVNFSAQVVPSTLVENRQ